MWINVLIINSCIQKGFYQLRIVITYFKLNGELSRRRFQQGRGWKGRQEERNKCHPRSSSFIISTVGAISLYKDMAPTVETVKEERPAVNALFALQMSKLIIL